MKNKLLLSLLIIVSVFTLTACGSGNESLHPNQTGYVEGKYAIDDLTFSLPDGYTKSQAEPNIYQLADDNNGIVIYFYHDKDIKTSLGEYIDSDPHYFMPNQKNIESATINGNEWYKGVTDDNAYIYYIQQGEEVYSIMIMPMFTTKSVLNELTTTLENSLYFK